MNFDSQRVLENFRALCAIPHGSGNTGPISAWCLQFARRLSLPARRDEYNNVNNTKPGTPGYETHPAVIVQGHLDMVCEKEPDCGIDFQKDGLQLEEADGFLFARGTTLGADDGVAVAYALTLLESTGLPHPPLEVLLTTDEETGMYGAKGVDLSELRGRRLLNLDSEDEGVFTVSCAGGAAVRIRLPLRRTAQTLPAVRLRVCGAVGGHSGVEIVLGRANTNCQMAQLLAKAWGPDLRLAALSGGRMDNAIPRATEAIVCTPEPELLLTQAAEFSALLHERFGAAEPELRVEAEQIAPPTTAMDEACSAQLVRLLAALPDGVRTMSADIPGLPQTSSNLGILLTDGDIACLHVSVRSSVDAEKHKLVDVLRTIAQENGASLELEGEYPAWEYRQDSPLRDTIRRVYTTRYGQTPRVEAIHAGLECGILAAKLPGLDAVSFGPTIHDIHTTRERLDLASCARTWELLCAILAEL